MTEDEVISILKDVTYRPGTGVSVESTELGVFGRFPCPGELAYGIRVYLPIRVLNRKGVKYPGGYKQSGLDFLQSRMQVFRPLDAETPEEFLDEVFKSLLQAETHEMKEAFRFKGRCVINPHPETLVVFDDDYFLKGYRELSGQQVTPGEPVHYGVLHDPRPYKDSAR